MEPSLAQPAGRSSQSASRTSPAETRGMGLPARFDSPQGSVLPAGPANYFYDSTAIRTHHADGRWFTSNQLSATSVPTRSRCAMLRSVAAAAHGGR